jgi:glutaminyl-tRNA synthetase
MNLPEGHVEWLETPVNPEDPGAGVRKVPFAREIWIDRDDFREDPPPKYFRLSPGSEVRLRAAYFLRCDEAVKDASGEVVELRCTYDPATKGGSAPDGRKVKATIHWVSVHHAVEAEARLYDHLFISPYPDREEGDWLARLNPDSLQTVTALIEPGMAGAKPGEVFQFERVGYFCVDMDSTSDKLVFNRTVTLRDTWAKIEARQG